MSYSAPLRATFPIGKPARRGGGANRILRAIHLDDMLQMGGSPPHHHQPALNFDHRPQKTEVGSGSKQAACPPTSLPYTNTSISNDSHNICSSSFSPDTSKSRDTKSGNSSSGSAEADVSSSFDESDKSQPQQSNGVAEHLRAQTDLGKVQ